MKPLDVDPAPMLAKKVYVAPVTVVNSCDLAPSDVEIPDRVTAPHVDDDPFVAETVPVLEPLFPQEDVARLLFCKAKFAGRCKYPLLSLMFAGDVFSLRR